jgi:hypothetical protein
MLYVVQGCPRVRHLGSLFDPSPAPCAELAAVNVEYRLGPSGTLIVRVKPIDPSVQVAAQVAEQMRTWNVERGRLLKAETLRPDT